MPHFPETDLCFQFGFGVNFWTLAELLQVLTVLGCLPQPRKQVKPLPGLRISFLLQLHGIAPCPLCLHQNQQQIPTQGELPLVCTYAYTALIRFPLQELGLIVPPCVHQTEVQRLIYTKCDSVVLKKKGRGVGQRESHHRSQISLIALEVVRTELFCMEDACTSPVVRDHFDSYLLANELVPVAHLEAQSLPQSSQPARAVAPAQQQAFINGFSCYFNTSTSHHFCDIDYKPVPWLVFLFLRLLCAVHLHTAVVCTLVIKHWRIFTCISGSRRV